MTQLDYLHLVSDFDGKTIKMPFMLVPANSSIRILAQDYQLVLDPGADNTALTRQFLKKNGYGKYQKTGSKKVTATGEVELLTCEINGITLANQYVFGEMKVDVLENWKSHAVVGVIGMDIISQLTLILSHEYGKFMLTDQKIPALAELFKSKSGF